MEQMCYSDGTQRQEPNLLCLLLTDALNWNTSITWFINSTQLHTLLSVLSVQFHSPVELYLIPLFKHLNIRIAHATYVTH